MRVFVIHLTGTHQTIKQSEFIRWCHWWKKIHVSIFPSTIHFSRWNNNSMREKATNQLAACSLMYVYICCSIDNQLWSVQGPNKRRESRARAFRIPCQQAAWCWCSLFSEGLCRQMTGQESDFSFAQGNEVLPSRIKSTLRCRCVILGRISVPLDL